MRMNSGQGAGHEIFRIIDLPAGAFGQQGVDAGVAAAGAEEPL